ATLLAVDRRRGLDPPLRSTRSRSLPTRMLGDPYAYPLHPGSRPRTPRISIDAGGPSGAADAGSSCPFFEFAPTGTLPGSQTVVDSVSGQVDLARPRTAVSARPLRLARTTRRRRDGTSLSGAAQPPRTRSSDQSHSPAPARGPNQHPALSP